MFISVTQAHELCEKSTKHILLDVRTRAECADGMAKNAKCLPLNELQQNIATLDQELNYYIMCATGIRTKQAIELLKTHGFTKLFHVENGFQEWKAQYLPIKIPKISQKDIRFSRHHQLNGFGKVAQDKLLNAHVLLIGAGGLGSPAALYLVSCGVGELTIVDDDVVSLSNLQRQIIHQTADIGKLKVDSAKSKLTALNPDTKINALAKKINPSNAKNFISQADVIIDGSDNLSTRYLVNDECLALNKPLVYAAVYQFESQMTVFDFREKNTPCLRCLFPKTAGFEPENCSTTGVLGVVPGLAGIMQASQAIKLITGIGKTLNGQLLLNDMLDDSYHTITYKINKNCQLH